MPIELTKIERSGNENKAERSRPCRLCRKLSEALNTQGLFLKRVDIVMTVGGLFKMPGWFTKFFANDVHIARSFDSNSNGVRADTDDRDRHVVANQDFFARLSREHQHTATPFMVL